MFVGLATLDLVQRVERIPGADAKATADWQELSAGGPALNAAVTFAALGGRAVLVSRVGDSPLGRLVADDLRRHGVRLVDLAAAGFTPPVSAVAVEAATGDRQVVSTDARGSAAAGPRERSGLCGLLRSAMTDLGPGGARPENREEVRGRVAAGAGAEGLATPVPQVNVVELDGHHPDLAHAVLDVLDDHDELPDHDELHDHDELPDHDEPNDHDVLDDPDGASARLVVLDAGRWKPQLRAILPRCTDVVCSAEFRLGDAPGEGALPADPREALLADLLARGARVAASTAGPQPILLRAVAEPTVTRLPVPVVDVIDTLGAGDALHGAYAWARAQGAAPAHALRLAATVASRSCEQRGTRAWLADLADLDLPSLHAAERTGG